MPRRKLKVGSLFSGIGLLDAAVEEVFGAETAWQVEREPARQPVLARHFPAASRYGDVEALNPTELEPVDILCAGFPCQDLSPMGKQAGLEGAQSGLGYRSVLRFARELQPRYVVLENAPALLKHRARVERDLGKLGYGVRWAQLPASAVGAPQGRMRTFVLAERGAAPGGVQRLKKRRRKALWPTPTKGDAKASGSRRKFSQKAHAGTSLTDAVRPDRYDPTYKGPKLRLNPAWQGQLLGIPADWSAGVGPSRHRELTQAIRTPRWPALRGRAQRAWEAPRTLMPDEPAPMRTQRLAAHGNAVTPAQVVVALRSMLQGTPLEQEAASMRRRTRKRVRRAAKRRGR